MDQAMIFEWIGYGASVLVVISLMMSSIVRLRWINLAGAAMMSLYGFLIHALPVGLLNLFIVFIDLYYLRIIYFSQDYFSILEVNPDSKYVKQFLDFYKDDIEKVMPDFELNAESDTLIFFVLRNMVPACLFVGKHGNSGCFNIQLDYVIPEYRDFKLGKFLFGKGRSFFVDRGISELKAQSFNKDHDAYLAKMGFGRMGEKDGCSVYGKILNG